uniref:Glutamine-dependent NAD(+) synthetase n=1 Tax=Solanum tuberosum TaxID=4113 RepID=M1D6I4_SOLTU
MDLRTFLKWVAIHLGYSFSTKIVAAPPTAEVEPIRSNYSQCMEGCGRFFAGDLSVSMFKICPLILICVTNGHKVDACRGG